MSIKKQFLARKELSIFLVLSLLVVGLAISVFVIRFSQDLRQRAATSTGIATLTLPASQPVASGSQVSFPLKLNTKTASVIGAQIYVDVTGVVPANLSYVPATINGMSTTINEVVSITGGKRFTIGLLTSNPSVGFSTQNGEVILGNFQFTAGSTGQIQFVFNSSTTKVVDVGNGSDVLKTPLSYTYQFSQGQRDLTTVNVIQPVNMTKITLGTTVNLSALGYDQRNQPIYSGISYYWGISSSASIATIAVNSNTAIAQLSARAPGTGDLFVTASYNGRQVTKSIRITVVAATCTSQGGTCRSKTGVCGDGAYTFVSSSDCLSTQNCCVPSPSATPRPTPTPTPRATASPRVTPTPRPTNSPTPRPSATASENPSTSIKNFSFLVKVVGVTQDRGAIKVVVRVGSRTSGKIVTKTISLNFAGNGTYKGTFEKTTSDDLNLSESLWVSIKGEKHVQRTFPTVSLTQNAATVDFTNRPLEPGDLGTQDGIVDSRDINKIVALFAKPQVTPSDLLVADVNYDGVVNSVDVGLVLTTLSTKSDESGF